MDFVKKSFGEVIATPKRHGAKCDSTSGCDCAECVAKRAAEEATTKQAPQK